MVISNSQGYRLIIVDGQCICLKRSNEQIIEDVVKNMKNCRAQGFEKETIKNTGKNSFRKKKKQDKLYHKPVSHEKHVRFALSNNNNNI